jgi:hypothetical protein
LREGAWIEAIYAQFFRDLHRNKSVETGKSHGILFSTEEKSFRGESGTEASQGGSATKLDSGNRRRQADGKLIQH